MDVNKCPTNLPIRFLEIEAATIAVIAVVLNAFPASNLTSFVRIHRYRFQSSLKNIDWRFYFFGNRNIKIFSIISQPIFSR